MYVDLTCRHLLQLTADDLTEGEFALLTENLCNLLALVDHAETPLGRAQPELQIEALLDFCRRNLHDPALSPDFVATHFGISTRTLHLRFERLQSFGRWLLDTRLDASSNALRNPPSMLPASRKLPIAGDLTIYRISTSFSARVSAHRRANGALNFLRNRHVNASRGSTTNVRRAEAL